jgi:hypothetical protein
MSNAADDERNAVRYEPKDVPALLPLWLGLGLAGFVAIVFLIIRLGFPLANEQQYRGPLQALPPAPRLQVAPHDDLVRYRQAKHQELKRAGIGIDAAMRETARQGWGTRP